MKRNITARRWSLVCLTLILSTFSLNNLPQTQAAYLAPYAPNLPTGAMRYRVGLATHPWWLDMHLDTFVQNFKQLNVGIVRLPVEWKVIEPTPGNYDWQVTDKLLNRLADENFEVVAEFVTIPPWASGNPAECAKADITCAFNPTYAARFQAVVEATARRYPFIRYWEFWNEPENWPNINRPDVYAEWLLRFHGTLKNLDNSLQVAVSTADGAGFMQGLYAAIERGGRKSYPWDAVAYHPYNLDKETDASGMVLAFAKAKTEKLRNLMVSKGESSKPIWITEIGFQSDPYIQAQMLKEAFDWLAVRNSYIQMIILHMLHDWTDENFGLMATVPDIYPSKGTIKPDTRFVPKEPFYSTFRDYPKRILQNAPAPDFDTLVFPETKQTVRGVFKKAWQSRGGLALFGLPKTGQFWERNPADGKYYLVQYFERLRMEYHPELRNTAFEVQFGLLGNEQLVEKGWLERGTVQAKHPYTQPEAPLNRADNQFFPQTNHNVYGLFLAAWKQQGGLSIIGLPRSVVYDGTDKDGKPIKIQYFERSRMELHTAPDGRQFILFGLLANERMVERGWLREDFWPATDNFYSPANFEFVINY